MTEETNLPERSIADDLNFYFQVETEKIAHLFPEGTRSLEVTPGISFLCFSAVRFLDKEDYKVISLTALSLPQYVGLSSSAPDTKALLALSVVSENLRQNEGMKGAHMPVVDCSGLEITCKYSPLQIDVKDDQGLLISIKGSSNELPPAKDMEMTCQPFFALGTGSDQITSFEIQTKGRFISQYDEDYQVTCSSHDFFRGIDMQNAQLVSQLILEPGTVANEAYT